MTVDVRPVADEEWGILAWLWQDFRHDLASVTHGFPYADGRYQHAWLDEYPKDDGAGYLAWSPHPKTGESAPVGFALVHLVGEVSRMRAFFVVPAARRGGLGRALAADVIARHPGAWEIPFQRDNAAAARFWRRVATDAWGGSWTERPEPVPGRPDTPPDHWIRNAKN